MSTTLFILSFVAFTTIVSLLSYFYGKKQTRKQQEFKAELKQKFAELKSQYERGLELQRDSYENKLKEIEGNFKSEVLKEIEKGNDRVNNPFGSYLIPVLKISSLYNIKDTLEESYRAGKISEESYKIKTEWLNKEIIRKTGSDYYDDTKLNIDEA